jgi:hypothetical protein
VNPGRALRRVSAERGWPVLVFRRPVTLRSRFPQFRKPSAPLVAGAVGLGLAAAGVALYGRHRRRSNGA